MELLSTMRRKNGREVNKMGSVLVLFLILLAFTIGCTMFRFVDAMIGKLEGSVSRETGRDVI